MDQARDSKREKCNSTSTRTIDLVPSGGRGGLPRRGFKIPTNTRISLAVAASNVPLQQVLRNSA